MAVRTLLEDLPDRRRICVMLRADGWSYDEIAQFLGIGVRMVRHELEQATHDIPAVLAPDRPTNGGASIRLIYLLGLSDGGVAGPELTDYLDTLRERSHWLRSRMHIATREAS